MLGKLIFVMAVLGGLSSFAIALTVTSPDFDASARAAYPTKADFDWTFAQFRTMSSAELENAADRESRRAGVLGQANSGHSSEK